MESELSHYGVIGMKWGVRRTPEQLGHISRPKHKAKKDAKEYARAKMFYGEGAGTRRKLIQNTVEQRSKDPRYKQAFDEALSKQDMAKHVKKAKNERKIKDMKKTTTKTWRGVTNLLTGHPERLGAGMATLATAVAIARKTGADKIVKQYAENAYYSVVNGNTVEKGKQLIKEILKRSG